MQSPDSGNEEMRTFCQCVFPGVVGDWLFEHRFTIQMSPRSNGFKLLGINVSGSSQVFVI